MPKLTPPKMKPVKSPILEASKKKGYGPGGPQTPGAKAKRNQGNDFDHSKTKPKPK